jgi:hypothetical protein
MTYMLLKAISSRLLTKRFANDMNGIKKKTGAIADIHLLLRL